MNKATIEQVRTKLRVIYTWACHDLEHGTSALNPEHVGKMCEEALAALSSAESEPTHSDVSQDGGNGDVKPLWKFGNEYAPYHPSASHVSPEYRDGWNACYAASQLYVEGVKPIWEELAEIGQEAASKGAFQSEVPALTALREVREALQFANDTPNGPISDTIWMMHRPETMFDYIDSVLSAPVQAAAEQKLLAALRPFAEAYEPIAESDKRWVNMTEIERAALDRSIVTPRTTMGDFRRAYEAVYSDATTTQASPDAQAIRDQALDDAIFKNIVSIKTETDGEQAILDEVIVRILEMKSQAPQPFNKAKHVAQLKAEIAAHLAEDEVPQPAQERCKICDGTGAEVGFDGEYLGACRFCDVNRTSQVKEPPVSLTSGEGEVRQAEADEREAAFAEYDRRTDLPGGMHNMRGSRPSFTEGWLARAALAQSPAMLGHWKAAFEEERRKFQGETLRASNLTAALQKFIKQHEDTHTPGPWSRGCHLCQLVAEANALLTLAAPQQGETK